MIMKLPRRQFLHLIVGTAALSMMSRETLGFETRAERDLNASVASTD
jgi:hypothetical protein